MQNYSDITIVTRLKLVDLIYPEANEYKRKSLKLYTLKTMGVVEGISEFNPAEFIEEEHKQPKTGQYVRELLKMGYTQAQVAEWFGISQAGVSYHLNKPEKSPYVNPHLQELRKPEHTSLSEVEQNIQDWINS